MSADMTEAWTTAFIGISVVFFVLVFLSFSFGAMKLISAGEKPEVKATAPAPADNAGESASGIEADAVAQRELTAAISAALVLCLDGGVVSSIRRVEDTTTWSRTGTHDQMVS